MSYTLPQVQVFQEVTQVPTAVTNALNPYVYGANYSLRRYAEAAEKPLAAFGAYDMAAGNTGDYPNKISGSIVDLAYLKLYADEAWLKYQTLPNSTSNPIYMTSDGIRHKLRAAPRIVDGGTSAAVAMVTAGYHTGTVNLPEAYYFYPQATFVIGAAAGVFNYVTTEDLTGTMAVPINASVAGVKVQGPDGLVMDFGAGASAASPRVITFAKAGSEPGTATPKFFTLSPKASKLKTMIDQDLDSVAHAGQVKVVLDSTALAISITYDGILLTIAYVSANSTLSDIRDAILLVPAVVADFDISALTGAGTEKVIIGKDQDSAAWTVARAVIPDSYRVYVYENTWVFQTANGVSRTGTLYKDVQVGDKITWTVTPASTGIEVSGTSTVVGLEADYSAPDLGDATADAANQATLTGNDLTAGVANITAGADNQEDFSAATTKTYALNTTNVYPILSLASGVLEDDFIITVTTAGTAVLGTAKVSVTSLSGTYSRTNVPVENEALGGAYAGTVYIGNNMVVKFYTADADLNFYAGDTWTVASAQSPFVAITNEIASGTYAGLVDTTYYVEVTRGGVFAPVALVTKGVTSTVGATLNVLNAVITGWTAGDVDDEYVLECTTAGSIAVARFKLSSNRGDNATSVSMVNYGAGYAVTVGASGLSLYFTSTAATSFVVGQYYVIQVKAARPKVRVTDSAGSDQESSVVVTASGLISVGLNGAKITFPANSNTLGGFATTGGLTLGDKFTITATASAPKAVQTIILADDLPSSAVGGVATTGLYNYGPDRFAADLMLVKTSKEIPRANRDPIVTPGLFNWAGTLAGFTVEAGITLQDDSWVDGMGEMPFLPLIAGSLYVEYRSLLLTYANAIYGITDIGTVVPQLGPACEDNPLSLGVYTTLENIGVATCYFSAITSDDATGDAGALSKAGLVSNIWGLNAAGVLDPARHSVLEAHINSMSTEIKKRWRAGFVGRELPVKDDILTAATNPLHIDWKAKVADDTRVVGNQFTKVTLSTDGSLLTALHVGDEVRLLFATDAWGETTYVTDTVAEISSNTVFYLTTGLAAAVTVDNKIEIYHPLDTQEQADRVKAISEGYASKRMYHIFPGDLGKYGTYVNAAYGAAAVVGIVGSVVPQQGLTNIEVNGFDDVPLAYGRFSYDQLNTIAEGGTMIIMQDIKSGAVYIRHQISTAYADGNLNTSELSMVKNLDSISYYFADMLKPFIGRYNITPELVSVLRTQIQDGLNYLGSLTSVGLLGPQIILSNGNTKIRTLEQHPALKDRIVAIVNIELPPPLNVVEFHIVV